MNANEVGADQDLWARKMAGRPKYDWLTRITEWVASKVRISSARARMADAKLREQNQWDMAMGRGEEKKEAQG